MKVADPSKEFEVCNDACKEGVGEVLTQEGKFIAYESRKLKDHEQRYSTYDLELTAAVHVLRVWRHYLVGKNFVLKIDHNSVTSYFKQDDLNSRQARWSVFLCKFDMDIQHVKGKENRVAHALSRKLHCVYELYYNHLQSKFLDQVKEEAQKYPEYEFHWQQMEESRKQGINFEYGVNNDYMLTFRGKVYGPNRVDLKELIMNENHRSNYGGHPGH